MCFIYIHTIYQILCIIYYLPYEDPHVYVVFWTNFRDARYFKQKIVAGEVGSSAMPHKASPRAEGQRQSQRVDVHKKQRPFDPVFLDKGHDVAYFGGSGRKVGPD